ncbi:MAG: hypothetical protein QXK94_01165 [Candidatus Jordarchaeales archaeon]
MCSPDICRSCLVEQCVWSFFFRNFRRLHIERAPPCIRNAYFERKFKIVLRYFSFILPLKGRTKALSCNEMVKRNLCTPDKFCKNMKRKEVTLYPSERLKLKIHGSRKQKG